MRGGHNKLDLTGLRFGKLVAAREEPERRSRRVYWTCLCDCGKATAVSVHALRSGNTRSCGCGVVAATIARTTKHGLSKTPEWRVWARMRDRCRNTNNPKYPNYGGRGITVCDRWQRDFAAFLADMGPRPAPHLSLDRINNDGNYEPGNCRWATASQQASNRRSRWRHHGEATP